MSNASRRGHGRFHLVATLHRSALDLGEPGRDREYGYGLVQAKDALDYFITASQTIIGGD